MKCPHCDHKSGFGHFVMTVMNPWRIRCAKCAKLYSMGRKGNLILLIGAIIGVFIGFALVGHSLPMMVGVIIGFGALAEFLIWALDEPVKK